MDENLNCGPLPVTGGDLPARKRGRPPIPVSPEVLERRIMSRQRVNSSRANAEGPTRKRGRPKRAAIEVILDPHPLSRPVVPDSCQQEIPQLEPPKHFLHQIRIRLQARDKKMPQLEPPRHFVHQIRIRQQARDKVPILAQLNQSFYAPVLQRIPTWC